jgi:superkiller protein 3
LIFSLTASCSTLDSETRNQQATAFYKLGVSYLNENKIQLAFVEFQKAYELNPEDKDILNGIGLIYLFQFEEVPKAIEFFEKAIRVEPDFSDAYNNLGYAHEQSGNYEKAISYYQKAVSNLQYPTPEKAYINMGNSYYRLGDYEQAIKAFKDALKRAPDLTLIYLRLALCYNAMSQYGYASTAMTEAIRLDPAYNGDKEKALEAFRTSLLKAIGNEEKDIRDYIEILNY